MTLGPDIAESNASNHQKTQHNEDGQSPWTQDQWDIVQRGISVVAFMWFYGDKDIRIGRLLALEALLAAGLLLLDFDGGWSCADVVSQSLISDDALDGVVAAGDGAMPPDARHPLVAGQLVDGKANVGSIVDSGRRRIAVLSWIGVRSGTDLTDLVFTKAHRVGGGRSGGWSPAALHVV